ncbi:MAG: RNA 3'-terminal phosphate cyclase [Candidatus Micrarchaeota archaeon]
MAIEIDGSFGEGGGQVIRTAMTLSAITGKAVTITKIRANRPNPGLQAQHLTACKAVRNVCRGTLSHAEVGSTELTFEPGPIVGGKYEFDIGTAGSVTLVAQTLLPILLRAAKGSELRIIGGTHVMKSPGFDYFEKVFLPAIARFGVDAGCRMLKPGYYPRGGGEIEVDVRPCSLKGCTSWPQTDDTGVLIRLSGLPTPVAIREKKIFVQNRIEDVRIRHDEALSIGNAVTAWRGFRGAYTLGAKGKRAEAVAHEALDAINAEKGDVDIHLADQLLLYAALAKGKTTYSTSAVSGHLKTNAYTISKFLDRKVALDNGTIMVD